MKQIIFSILVCSFIAGAVAQYNTIKDYCTSSETKKKCKAKLSPFKYDASKLSRITFKDKKQFKELEIPMYFGEKYRLIWNTEGCPQKIGINVYNRKFDSKKRQLLWSNRDKMNETEFVWEPDKSRKMFIDYDIPTTTDTIKKGCVVFVLGYKIK